MFKPEQHEKGNYVTKKDASLMLKEYIPKMKLKHDCSVMDLGCGEGTVTATALKNFLPPTFKKLVGCDISEEMVKYANEQYGDEKTSFTVFDGTSKLPEHMKNAFDHVFSFYAVHWMKPQQKAFGNVYNILKEDGECLLVFIGYTAIADFYRALARHVKWKELLQNVENYISPYQDSQDPRDQVQTIMEEAGFKNIHIGYVEKSITYDAAYFKAMADAICPFKIPADLHEDFMDDYMQVVKDMNLMHEGDSGENVCINYSLITAYGSK